jgi:hypothetical protein
MLLQPRTTNHLNAGIDAASAPHSTASMPEVVLP